MPLFRRRPLLRAAMIGGGAYAVGKHAQRSNDRETDEEARLDQLENQPQQAAAPAPPAAAAPGGMTSESIEQLKQLGQLHEQGVLTDEEFAVQKRKVLA